MAPRRLPQARALQQLLEPFEGLLEQNDEDEGGIELADVVDTASGAVVALYARWPVYVGALIDAASGEVIGDVIDGYFDAHGDDALRARMRAAGEATAPLIRFLDRVDYSGGRDAPKQAPAPAAAPGDPVVLAEIRAPHAELDEIEREPDIGETMRRIDALLWKVFAAELRPYPVLRSFELTEAQRACLDEAIEAAAKGAAK